MHEIFALAESGEIGSTSLNLSAALIFIGVAGKSAQFPFHVWLPDAMEGPTPVSALIHAATLVIAGIYFLARLSPMLIHTPGVLAAIAAVGLFTAFLGAVLALAQKRPQTRPRLLHRQPARLHGPRDGLVRLRRGHLPPAHPRFSSRRSSSSDRGR